MGEDWEMGKRTQQYEFCSLFSNPMEDSRSLKPAHATGVKCEKVDVNWKILQRNQTTVNVKLQNFLHFANVLQLTKHALCDGSLLVTSQSRNHKVWAHCQPFLVVFGSKSRDIPTTRVQSWQMIRYASLVPINTQVSHSFMHCTLQADKNKFSQSAQK